MNVLIGGSNSNLSYFLKKDIKNNKNFDNIEFLFFNKRNLDITDINSIEEKISYYKPNFFINTSAYTNVDKAEKNIEDSFSVNTLGPKNLSIICNKFETTLIHFSTDYVYDGIKKSKYKESDETNPLSVYGFTKLLGDKEIFNNQKKFYIFRVSWLIDSYCQNFLTKIINLLLTKKEINIVDDQISLPTYYSSLSKTVLSLILNNNLNNNYGIYNYTSAGNEISRYKFSKMVSDYLIKKKYKVSKIKPISSKFLKNQARRPSYSCLNCMKIRKSLNINLIHWEKKIESTIDNYLKDIRK